MPSTPHLTQPVSNAARSDTAVITSLEFLAFTLGQEEYGIDIRKVQELRRYDAVTHITNVPEFIKDVVDLHGIIDMCIKLTLGHQLPTNSRS